MLKAAHLPTAIILLGGILLLGSFAWSKYKDPRDYWSEQEAQELTDVGLIHHGLAHRLGHASSEAQRQELQKQFDQSKERRKQLNTRFTEAKARYQRPARILWWSGMACFALGALVYVVVRAKSDRV